MAKATFQRNQKVWVESVGAWSVVERIVPIWAKDFEEPIRISYDVGLGRTFMAHELRAEESVEGIAAEGEAGWRLLRARNKWQTAEDCSHHPFPGTFPVVVTDKADWGGWRVPGAEYDRDPRTIERQARLIVSAPKLAAIARALVEAVAEAPADAGPLLRELAEQAAAVERYVREVPARSPAELSPEPRAAAQ
ncbi:MAG TPA: hypothetical protein VGS12_05645 [Caulobacteraceae bacterium]|nr:hypothetical protein [Caulobacteraceae bacterium]